MTYALHYFVVKAWEGELQNREFNQITWVSKEILPTLTHLSGNKNILERLEREGIPH